MRNAQSLRVLTWNLERKSPESPRGSEAVDYLFGLEPDVMVLTEARTSFPLRGGHALWCEPPLGTRFAANERKVLIWSKEQFTEIATPHGLDQSRFIGGSTNTTIGQIDVLGVCIPWHMAEVTYPTGEKRKPWAMHMQYLDTLSTSLTNLTHPTVVAGDYNQRIPRQKYGSVAAAQALAKTFAPLHIVTTGQLANVARPGIDHIATSTHLAAANVWGWPNDVNGQRLSDHDGAGADLSHRLPH